MEEKMRKPGRPLGVSLAIIASLIIFSVTPLLQVGLLLSVKLHFQNMTYPEGSPQPIFEGSDIIGISYASIAIQAALALVFLVIAVLAWRGRPAFIRYILMTLVVAYTAIQFAVLISQNLQQQNLQVGVSSFDSIIHSMAATEFVTGALVTLYVVWYLNRGPARAFYRGYYLTPTTEPMPE